jgi:predicted dehydrogenase
VIRVAVVGLGSVGRRHLHAFAADPRVEVAVACDADAGVLHAVDAPAKTEDWREAVTRPDVHAVAIASYDDAHFAQALAALEAGKHVFCEKPLCRTLEEARALAAAQRRVGAVVVSNLVLRTAPLYRWLREQVRAGALGRVYAFDGDYLYGRLAKLTQGWRGAVENYSVMLGGGIHLVDLMLWTTGERPVAVGAVGNRIATEGTGFPYPDFVAATYELPSGLVGRITANFGSVTRHQHVVRVFGTEATFVHDDAGARLHVERDPGAPPRLLEHAPLPPSKSALVGPFLDAIERGEDGEEAFRHELDVVACCVAADAALTRGGRTRVEYV